jgi:hypothetical protein
MNLKFANIGHDGNTLAISSWPANVNSNGANGGAPWESDGAAEKKQAASKEPFRNSTTTPNTQFTTAVSNTFPYICLNNHFT